MKLYDMRWQELKHRGGTKRYLAVLITGRQTPPDALSKGLFITNWGKVGAEGQMLAQVGTPQSSVERYVEKLRQKGNAGYDQQDVKALEGVDYEIVRSALKDLRLWGKIDKGDLIAAFGDDYYTLPSAPVMHNDIPVAVEKTKPSSGYADDPLWGIF